MNDKSALLEQLRLHRGVAEAKNLPAQRSGSQAARQRLRSSEPACGFSWAGRAGYPCASRLHRSRAAALRQARRFLTRRDMSLARREATVSSKITGKVLEVLIEEGQRVAANEVLARLDDPMHGRACSRPARRSLRRRRILRPRRRRSTMHVPVYHREEQERTQALISAQDFDAAKATYNAAAAAFAVAQRSVAVARSSLSSRSATRTIPWCARPSPESSP